MNNVVLNAFYREVLNFEIKFSIGSKFESSEIGCLCSYEKDCVPFCLRKIDEFIKIRLGEWINDKMLVICAV